MSKVHLSIQTVVYEGMICKLFAVVKGDRVTPLFVRPEEINDRLADQAGLLKVTCLAKLYRDFLSTRVTIALW